MIKFIFSLIQNRLLIIVLGLLVLGGGYYSYKGLPVDALPDVTPTLVQVFTVTQGLAPEEVEKYVTYPIEIVMAGLPNIKEIRSVSNFGLSVVNIYFNDGTDIYFARQLVNERIQQARETIPDGFGDPEMGPISTAMGLVLFYYLEDQSGNYTLEELRTIQDWTIKPILQTVPGVTEVLGIGGYEKQFHVQIDPKSLLKYNVTLSEVVNSIESNNLNVGAQFIVKNAEEYIVRSEGLAGSKEDIEKIIIKSFDGTPIYLKDLAVIEIGGAVRRGLQTKDGEKEVVAGMVIKLYGTNSSTVIKKVEDKLDEINNALPSGVKIVPYYQQKSLVEASIRTVTHALGFGILLVVIVLFAFLGSFRPSIVVMLSLPFSILFAFIGMKYFGISANLMSFGGLAIAIGMLVDGSIVIVENVDRLLSESDGKESKISIIATACKEVIRPIFFSILIVIVVFLPLFTLQGVEGKTFGPLAYTLTLAMFGSLIFSIFIAPVLSYLLISKEKLKGSNENWFIVNINKLYNPLITFFVNRRRYSVFLGIILVLIGAIIFTRLGSEFTPKMNEGTLVLRLTMAPSIALDETKRVTMLVEKRLIKIPEIKEVVTRIGRGEVGAHADPTNNSEMYIILNPKKEWRTARNQEDIENIIREELGDVPGVAVNLTQPIKMTVDELLEGVRGDFAIKLFGDDLDILKEKADEISNEISQIKGATDVQTDQVIGTPQLLIKINRNSIARYGINISDVQEVIRAAVGGRETGQVFEGVRRFDILVRFQPKYRDTPEAIGNILIKSSSGSLIPLNQLADINNVVGPRQITRENNQRFITIQGNVVGTDIGSFVDIANEKINKNVKIPPGYLINWGGQFKLQQEANKRLKIVIPVMLLIIFILLFANFRSLKNSYLILLNIPLALVGGVIALWVTGQNLSVPSSVGFIALFGIALENGLILVTYLNQLTREGLSMSAACIKAATLRLRPVLMTAVTTAFGLLPLLLSHGTGSEIQKPLATVVIGGLFTSTLLTLLVLPAIYPWFSGDLDKQNLNERQVD